MKRLLLLLLLTPAVSFAQYNVAYTVTITELRALADDCDGGAPFCLNAPQDPVFNIWTNDGEANENHNCWIFEDDNDIEYGLWKDIQNLEIANHSGVNTSYISFDMSGFESDNLSPGCSDAIGDDAVYGRQFVQQFDLSTLPEQTVNEVEIDLDDVYFAKVEIWWEDLNAGLFNLDSKAQFSMAPNPSEGIFTVTLEEEGVSTFDVQVIDVAGRTIYSGTSMTDELSIDLNNQNAGVYFVNVDAEGKTATRKLMLK